jgi:hypothetical protein
MGAKVKVYDLSVSHFDKQYLYLGIDKGHRVEPMNLNFMIVRNYLALGMSYF